MRMLSVRGIGEPLKRVDHVERAVTKRPLQARIFQRPTSRSIVLQVGELADEPISTLSPLSNLRASPTKRIDWMGPGPDALRRA